MHALDRPVWASLQQRHAGLAEGTARARRYRRDVNVFASTCDDDDAAWVDLASLVPSDGTVHVLQVPAIVPPQALRIVKAGVGVQMVAPGDGPAVSDAADIVALTGADAAEMVALAHLTEPGPFLANTHTMGRFLGIRIQGRLAAMAGERMRPPGHTEVSGVCTHPDFRGRGLARRLSAAVTAAILARGDVAFLHVWRDNLAAIALYEGLGFRPRAEVQVAVLARG